MSYNSLKLSEIKEINGQIGLDISKFHFTVAWQEQEAAPRRCQGGLDLTPINLRWKERISPCCPLVNVILILYFKKWIEL